MASDQQNHRNVKGDEDSDDSPFVDVSDEKSSPSQKMGGGRSSPPTKSVSFHQDSLVQEKESSSPSKEPTTAYKSSKKKYFNQTTPTTPMMKKTTYKLGLLQSSSKVRLEQFLISYIKFTSKAINQDKGLSFLQWTLWLFSKIFERTSRVKKLKLATRTSIVIYSISQALYKLSGDVSFVRYALRLYGWPYSLEAICSDSWGQFDTSKPDNRTDAIKRYIKYLGRVMSLSMLCYYPLEHIAYIKWMITSTAPVSKATKNIPYFNTLNANKFSAYSCRAWFVYIISDIVQCLLKLRLLSKEKQNCNRKRLLEQNQQEEGINDKDEKNADDLKILNDIDNSICNQKLQLSRSLLFVLPCVHWSLPHWDTTPFLSETTTNSLMWFESLISMYQAMRNGP